MQELLWNFQRLNGTTWFYFSLLLTLSIFVRYSRFLSLRNWDVASLFLLGPGLLATTNVENRLLHTHRHPDAMGSLADRTLRDESLQLLHHGYIWLFVVSGYLLLRCVCDVFLTRRPRIEPNMNTAGLACLSIALFGFLMVEVMTKAPDPSGRASADVALLWVRGEAQGSEPTLPHPMTTIAHTVVASVTKFVTDSTHREPHVPTLDEAVDVARTLVILSHLSILTALVVIGWRHFDGPLTGVGMASLYLLLPMTAMNVEKVDHLLPSALLLWAIHAYRQPITAGLLFGVSSLFFYPLFLLPLWLGFYWRRGLGRFVISMLAMSAVLWTIVYYVEPLWSFMEAWLRSVSWRVLTLRQSPETLGFWTEPTSYYRLPILIGFLAAVAACGFWPADKNLADLIALSAGLILGMQFWYADRGGTYVHWHLPLLLLMFFRPNLTDARPPLLARPPDAAGDAR